MATALDALKILLVEDNYGDVLLVREALGDMLATHDLHITRDGVEAMEFLRQRGSYHQAPRPDVVILDLNLPRKNGREVLADLTCHPALRTLPVVVFTTSRHEGEIVQEFPDLCLRFEVKPRQYDALIDVMRRIERFARQHSDELEGSL